MYIDMSLLEVSSLPLSFPPRFNGLETVSPSLEDVYTQSRLPNLLIPNQYDQLLCFSFSSFYSSIHRPRVREYTKKTLYKPESGVRTG